MFRPLLLSLAAFSASAFAADPFESCPTQAFLMQGSPAKLYGVDLSTGSYRTLANNVDASSVVNAVGFSFHDQYIYGWDKALQTLVRIGSDHQREAISLVNPLNGHYYVGDVATNENAYYFYRKGSNALHGLWRISLDDSTDDYLEPTRIVDGSSMYLNIYDFAFHPDNNLLYSVDSRGRLISIDPVSGSFEFMANLEVTGTFGAIYFDVDGMLYASRNKDGKIFRVDVNTSAPFAEYFAQGPSSSSNDGARCAFAPVTPIESDPSTDYGDAPDSYQTSLSQNGARHGRDDNLYLGSSVDYERQAYLHPESDDSFDVNDEDGVTFVTALEAGNQGIVRIEANGTGFLSGWIDFNRNGQFESNEKIITDEEMSNETQNFIFDVPVDTVPGTSWSRFRLSSNTGTEANGGVPAGEVEDHQVALSSQSATTLYYPSSSGFVTLAYEDLWPSMGDYDMNDFVVHYRTATRFVGDAVTGVTISGEMMAIGATFHNGFGVHLPGVPREAVNDAEISYVINGEPQSTSPLEAGQSNVVLIVVQDIWDYVTPPEGCSFYRTEENCGDSNAQATFSITIEFNQGLSPDAFADRLFSPFIFATPGFLRSSIFESPPGRALEIHLKNRAPTDLADPNLLGRASDRSDSGTGQYFQTENGMPWAVEIGTEWKHPSEYIDLIDAYPEFVDWVVTDGAIKGDWYLIDNAVLDNLYRQGN